MWETELFLHLLVPKKKQKKTLPFCDISHPPLHCVGVLLLLHLLLLLVVCHLAEDLLLALRVLHPGVAQAGHLLQERIRVLLLVHVAAVDAVVPEGQVALLSALARASAGEETRFVPVPR